MKQNMPRTNTLGYFRTTVSDEEVKSFFYFIFVATFRQLAILSIAPPINLKDLIYVTFT
jgi:hypothetical protein